jgi:hypothetical protein
VTLGCLAVRRGPLFTNIPQIGQFSGLNSPLLHAGDRPLCRWPPLLVGGWGHTQEQSCSDERIPRPSRPAVPLSAAGRTVKSGPGRRSHTLAYARPPEKSMEELVRNARMCWAIEECFRAARNECRLDQYEVRRYTGWIRHVALSMLAHAFLAAMAVTAASKGAPETFPAPWSASPWPRSAGSCQLVARSASATVLAPQARAEPFNLAPPTPRRRSSRPVSAPAPHVPRAVPSRPRQTRPRPPGSPRASGGTTEVLLEYYRPPTPPFGGSPSSASTA